MSKFNDVYRTDMAVTVDESGFKEQTMIEYGREKTVFIAPSNEDSSDTPGADTNPEHRINMASMNGYLKEDDADLKYAPISAPTSTTLFDSDVVLIKANGTYKAVSLATLKDYLLA